MKYSTFGRLGWRVSEIGFDAWVIDGTAWEKQDDNDSFRAFHKAQGYGNGHSERIIGPVLKDRVGQRIYVATKIPPRPGTWPPMPSDKIEDDLPENYLCDGVEASLNWKSSCANMHDHAQIGIKEKADILPRIFHKVTTVRREFIAIHNDLSKLPFVNEHMSSENWIDPMGRSQGVGLVESN